MASQQSGADQAAEQPGAPVRAPQMDASQSVRAPKAPTPAAFGTGSGAAIVFRDYASI